MLLLLKLINIKGFIMKTLLKIAALSSIVSMVLVADPIDGTLAVDNYNKNQNTLSSQQLDSMLDDNSKYTSEAQSMPAPTGGYSASFLEGPFVGFELNGVTSIDAEGIDTSGISWGLRFGAQNLEWRTMAILERFSTDNGINDYLKGSVQLDYFFLGADNLMLDTYAIRPYFGLNVGAMDIDTATESGLKTITYGAQLGATMSLTQQVDLDLGFRYDLATSDKVDHTSNISAGLHYKY